MTRNIKSVTIYLLTKLGIIIRRIGMSEYLDLAGQFINIRRSLPYIRFDNEVSKKIKHEIFILSYLKLHNGVAHPKELSEEFIVSTARMAVLLNQLEEKGYIIQADLTILPFLQCLQ